MLKEAHRRTIVTLAVLVAALATTSTATASISRGGQRPATFAGPQAATGEPRAVTGEPQGAMGGPFAAVTVTQLRCPTTYGYPFTQPPVGATVAVAIPVVVRPLVTAYANDNGMIVAPAAWKCVGHVGADSSWIMTVSDTHNAKAEIATAGAATCYGCALTIAAPYFPRAASLLKALCGTSCVPGKPTGTIASPLGPEVVYFENPPATGRPYRTRGVVIFQDGSSSALPFAARATCTVPSSSVYLCQPILAAFVSEFDVRAAW